MDRPHRFRWPLLALLALLVLLAWASAASARGVSIARLDLDANPPPERVLAGDYDLSFKPAPDAMLVPTGRKPAWWRITFDASMAAGEQPQLVMVWPQRKQAELWVPGSNTPIKRSVYGPDADFAHSPRVLSFPLSGNVVEGQTLYLRVTSPNLTASVVQLQAQRDLQREDLRHAEIRSTLLTILALLALLAFGLWISLGERGYGYLALTLFLQMFGQALDGGELRAMDWIAAIATDSRTNIVLNTAAVLASVRFLIFFLGLRSTQPDVTKVLNICSAMLGGLLLVSIFAVWRSSALFGNMTLLMVIATVLYASMRAMWKRQREAYFLLLAWAPMMLVVVMRVGALHQWWPTYSWLEYGYSTALAAGGLGLLIGLADKLRQLRHDRDRARYQATYDPLTGLMTRAALENALAVAVENAHRTATPLSVVFFDVDHFKRVNDDHGHHVGDEVLRAVGSRTLNRARAADLCGRYGGDEVVIALVQTKIHGAMRFAEHLRETISAAPVVVNNRSIPIAISVGVAELRAGETAQQMLARADEALYASKTGGRGRTTEHGYVA